jgi:hypothetical protein
MMKAVHTSGTLAYISENTWRLSQKPVIFRIRLYLNARRNKVEPLFYTKKGQSRSALNCRKWAMHTKNIWKHIKHTNNLQNLYLTKFITVLSSGIYKMNL